MEKDFIPKGYGSNYVFRAKSSIAFNMNVPFSLQCCKNFEWNDYKLKNGKTAFGPAMISHQVNDNNSKEDGSYVVIVHCPTSVHI